MYIDFKILKENALIKCRIEMKVTIMFTAFTFIKHFSTRFTFLYLKACFTLRIAARKINRRNRHFHADSGISSVTQKFSN